MCDELRCFNIAGSASITVARSRAHSSSVMGLSQIVLAEHVLHLLHREMAAPDR
jgi:hypothetical protein